MKINVTGKTYTPDYRNKYFVECEAMFGDADGEATVIVGGFLKGRDEEVLEDFLLTCERLSNAYPNGRGGGDEYNHVEGFNRWFQVESLERDEWDSLPEVVQILSADWVMEPDGMGHHATFEGYEVFYYDENGVKFNVAVEL